MENWLSDAIFYHIYPLGLCEPPKHNDFSSPATPRLTKIYDWLDHIQELGANALYLGPLFESTAHGYDTVDYFHVDRRLGNNQTLRELSAEIHRRGMRLVLDGVFNHVGRDFWAFQDVRHHQAASSYTQWFANLRFDQPGPCQDGFAYEGWAGHYDLVKLNTHNAEVRAHLFAAVTQWVEEYAIDGLRLDAADCLDADFLRALASHCRALRPDFALIGEVVHGDYRAWANPDMLDSVTNYELYKALYSSHADRNYYEIAYALNRQFGADGLYRGLPLYAFADNHDVNRVASRLGDAAHLYPLHILLFSMPGVPSIYYGSEWGIAGERTAVSDAALRPALLRMQPTPHPDLAAVITRLAGLRQTLPALRHGDYTQLAVQSEQFAFQRVCEGQSVVVMVNAAPAAAHLALALCTGTWDDALNSGERIQVTGSPTDLVIPANWGRVLVQTA